MPSQSPLFASVVADTELMDELQSRVKKSLATHSKTLESRGLELPMSDLRAVVEGGQAESSEAQSFAEAIVLVDGRPSLFIENDQFEEPDTTFWKTRLNPFRESLSAVIRSVGRVELTGHPSFDWVGTGWVIGDRLIATNRHVAMVFAQRGGAGFVFRQGMGGRAMTARLDFKEEFQGGAAKEVAVSRVLFISPDTDGQPDMAVLELADTVPVPSQLTLAPSSRVSGPVAAIGYPAHDSRNGEDAQQKIFGDIYDVKRFAPGFLMSQADANTLRHNCSTLGGNSGSAVVEVGTGRVVGLHFGGQFKTANFAVKSEVIRGVMDRLPASRPFLPAMGGEAEEARTFEGRQGYKADFLGSGKRVKLPTLSGDQEDDATPVRGGSDFVLAYTNFSVVMCTSRRMCYFSAVNIDGKQSVRPPRSGSWGLDPRIPADAQVGDNFYRGSPFSRGHITRRLDPVWGSKSDQANLDTFTFTNACPQVQAFNGGSWGDLEDFILDNADNRDLKVNVITGPVFATTDPTFREVKIPVEFWKVVVMVKRNGQLSATAYLQTQQRFLTGLEELPAEFVFGAFRTFQVPITRVERKTGLTFGNLSSFDPLHGQEAVGGGEAREVSGPDDLML